MSASPTLDELEAMDDAAFRRALRHRIETNYLPALRNPPKRLHRHGNRVWYLGLAEQGWLAPGRPREYDGMGLPAARQLIMLEELERHGCMRAASRSCAAARRSAPMSRC